jgi:hypothetical protein
MAHVCCHGSSVRQKKKSQSNPNVTAERNLSISVKQIKKNKLESPK